MEKNRLIKLAQTSEQIIGLDLVYFIKNNLFLTLTTVVKIITGFILSYFFANFLSQTIYGQYAFFFSIISTLSIFTLTGMNRAIIHASIKKRDGVIIEAVKKNIQFSFLGTLALFAGALYYLQGNKPRLSPIFILAGLLFPFYSSFNFYNAYLQARKKFKTLSLYLIITTLILNTALIAAIFFLPQIFWIVFINLLIQAIISFIFFLKIKAILRNRKVLKSDLSFGYKLTVLSTLSIISNNIDKILLAKLLGFEKLAIYTFSIGLPSYINILFKNISQLAIPKIAAMNKSQVKKQLPKKLLLMFLIIIPVICLYLVSAKLIFITFYPHYQESILYSQIYSLIFLFMPITIAASSFYNFKKIKSITIINTTSSASRIILFLIFLPKLGIMGGILGSLFSELIKTAAIIVLFKKI